jgi:hypothetical protein
MLQEYGSLTVKGPMFEFKNKWLWYEAFGGKQHDELYKLIQKECAET